MAYDKDGGPAFPRAPFTYSDVQELKWDVREQSGMSLHSYFAAAALPAVIRQMAQAQGIGQETFWTNVAAHCNRAADAMLKVREP